MSKEEYELVEKQVALLVRILESLERLNKKLDEVTYDDSHHKSIRTVER